MPHVGGVIMPPWGTTVLVGGNLVDIGPAGVTIQGALVRINSGGAAGTGSGSSPTAPEEPDGADDDNPGQVSSS